MEPIVRAALDRELVYDYLREAILSGELKPDEKIVEAPYTKFFGVSRTPVREALRMLEKDGLVVYAPQRGSFVRSTMTEKEIRETFMIRRALQMISIDGIIDNATNEDIEIMAAVILEGRRHMEAQDIIGYVKSNNRFNHRLILSCRIDMLVSILLQLERYNPVFSFIEEETSSKTFVSKQQRCIEVLQEHEAILTSIKMRDRERLRETLDRHILNTKDAYLETIR